MSISFNRAGLQFIQRRFFVKKVRPLEERMRVTLNLYKNRRLVLVRRVDKRPDQYQVPKFEPNPTVVTKERKLPSLRESALPYAKYSKEESSDSQQYGTYYDPLFNPHLLEGRHQVDPNEEPFNAIYADSQSEAKQDYTQVRDITSPELWACVERLARITIMSRPKPRKANEPVRPLPSGYVPPPETPPELPYFIARTRNHLLPVYYKLHSDPNECTTSIKNITGDLWKLEEDLRTHLESSLAKKRRILSSVQEPDRRIVFRGRWLHETVDWLHAQGF